MPNTQVNRSAEKRVRQDRRKREKNRVVRGYIRDMLRNVRSETDPDNCEGLLKHSYSVLDKAVKKNIIHRKTAARYKSRLALHTQRVKENRAG